MAEIAGWFTMNGKHIPYMKGQSKAEAAQKYMNSKHGKEVARLSSKTYTKKKNKFNDSYESLEKAADVYAKDTSNTLTDKAYNFYDRLGYTAKPAKVSKTEFEKVSNESEFGIIEKGYRNTDNLTTKEMMNQFENGKLYLGDQRAHGIGTYFGHGKDAHSIAREFGSYKDENILKATVSKDAKVITAQQLSAKRNEYSYKSFKKANEISKVQGEAAANAYYNKMNKVIMNDSGIFAASLGYDAINIPDAGYIVVLNRGKVIVSE